ncbi:hypothetical protein LPJ53_002852 [Coemansia erecta]|uniref:Dihydropteridine reductase n=1 Tax=Coemansia erecta TaxID=147472 RepID=A0A9W8CRF4_9FUNG|nr:hypothetical protein LPJ53_002852 [Coemansia erecta]
MPVVIVYGGLGALGSAVVKTFKKHSWKVINVAFDASSDADANIKVSRTDGLSDQGAQALDQIKEILSETKADAVICAAGGWQGGNAASRKFLDSVSASVKQSIDSSAVSASIASRYLKPDGLLALTGAEAVSHGGTPGMIGYGLAKAAVHQMVSSLAMVGSGVSGSVVGVLPITIDTPNNRAAMPDADFSSWTPAAEIADQLFAWAAGQTPCESGRLYKFITKEGATRIE